MQIPEPTREAYQAFGQDRLPGHLGLEVLEIAPEAVRLRLTVRPELMAPNGFLHAGTILTLADTCAGYGCVLNLPEGARGFTTIETKTNHLSTVREGGVVCTARPVHRGRTTQVWDATVSDEAQGRTLALFRCTQMILWP